MTASEDDLPPPRRWPLVIALVAALLWLVFTAAVAATLFPGLVLPAWVQTAASPAAAGLGMLAPLAVVWLVALRLRDGSDARAARTALMAEQARFAEQQLAAGDKALAALEGRLTALLGQIETAAVPLAAQHEALAMAATRLDASGAALAAATDRSVTATAALGEATPAAIAQTEGLIDLLTAADARLQGQLADAETLLAALWTRVRETGSEADAIAAATTAHLANITAAGTTARAALEAPLADMAAAVEAALAGTAAAATATSASVDAQASTLLSSVEAARTTFDHIGSESARLISDRMDILLAAAGHLSGQLEDHAERYRSLIEQVERGFAILDAKLGNSVAGSNAALESIAVRMTDSRDAIFRLGEPIAATDAALAAVEARVADVGNSAVRTLAALDHDLPASLPHVEALSAGLADLHDRTAALADPLARTADSLGTARNQLETARAAAETAAAALAEQLENARSSLTSIEQMTGSTALAASSQLIDVFTRVREIAGQTAGTMRESLAAVVAEAETALTDAGGTPLRAKLAEISDANAHAAASAQVATERVTQRLLALTRTIATVEARIDEADAHYDMRLRDDIAKRSSVLLASLNDGAIDIAKLLAIDVDDNVWQRYLKGDKGIFARRAVRLIDGSTARAIARHYNHDPAFREQATRYIDEFEMLIQRVLPDREGKGLAVTLLSSDVGKLYVALAQGTERLR